MDVTGEHFFRAPREAVWECFLDPVALQAAMPGCEEFREVGRDEYAVAVRVGLSELRGSYHGTVRVADRRGPERYRLAVQGLGKSGNVSGEAVFTLTERNGGTSVRYDGELTAKGAIARLGLRLLGGSAKLLIGQFMKGMEQQVAARTVV